MKQRTLPEIMEYAKNIKDENLSTLLFEIIHDVNSKLIKYCFNKTKDRIKANEMFNKIKFKDS